MTIQALRAQTGRALGFGAGFDGTPAAYSLLSVSDQVALTNAMKAAIRSNPADFTPTQVAIAGTPDIGAPESYGLGEIATDFFGEMGNQAQQINPLSSVNRTAFAVVLGAALVLGAGAYFFAKGGGKLPDIT
jgi:hypothetical protein